ncbi:MAG: helix-turn-helix domain-containing protein [Gammaproteobacteria bacterium]|nr:helix-turn-helix domain-containing protein [Gammaproteobacteria bacterium]
MLTYSTRALPPRAQVSYWNDIIADVFTPLQTSPLDSGGFAAEARAAPLGRLVVTNIQADPATIQRTREQAAQSCDRRFFLHMLVSGRLRVTQEGREALLQEGDLALADSSLPYTLHHTQPCNLIVLVMSQEDLKQHLPHPEDVIGVRFPGDSGLSNTTSVMLRSLWEQARDEIDPEIGSRIADSLLEMFAASWLARNGVQPVDSAVSGYRRVQIKRYIEAHLRDPELSARSVAAAFGISPRYLHMLFVKEGETVSNYMLRRRLEQCVKQLSDPLWRKRTITEIAFSWGFNNATHFARVFRHRYETTPRDFRNARGGEGEMTGVGDAVPAASR